MTFYEFPSSLHPLRDWLRGRGFDVTSAKTERQAAFMAQQLVGTRLKFPDKGQSCFMLLQSIQRSLPAITGNASSEATVRSERKVDATAPKARKSKGRWAGKSSADRPQINTTVPSGLVIYADGACEPNPGVGGWGFVVYRNGVEVHAEHGGDLATTNNAMEMTGALMALRWFADRGIIEPVRLLCDSQYVVKGANEWRHGWKRKGWRRGLVKELANADLWQELDEALTLVPLKLEWVRGHVGVRGNERADELAEEGRQSVIAISPMAAAIEAQLHYEIGI